MIGSTQSKPYLDIEQKKNISLCQRLNRFARKQMYPSQKELLATSDVTMQ